MATYEKKLTIGSLVAGSDLSTKNHFLVKVSGANELDLAGAGEAAIGVVGNTPEAGQPVECHVGIIVQVSCGAAVSAGDKLMSDGSGQAITAVASAGNHVVGIALEAAAAADDEADPCSRAQPREEPVVVLPRSNALPPDGDEDVADLQAGPRRGTSGIDPLEGK